MIEVLSPGAYTTIQDLGRIGYEAHGMPRSGAFDPFLASIANRIAGNTADAPLLEFALAGPSLRFQRRSTVALAAFNAGYLLNGSPVSAFRAFQAPAGSSLEFNGMQGWFGYLAVAGGIVADRILGSASTYATGGIGRRLTKGDRLAIGAAPGKAGALHRDLIGFDSNAPLSILPSVHTSLFAADDLKILASDDYQILHNSDRMGIALQGPAIAAPRVIRSAPAFPGSIQVLPSGQLLLLGPEGPTTGGYPQIAVLSKTSWTTLAQAQPGRTVRFEWITREEAVRRLASRNSILQSDAAWENP